MNEINEIDKMLTGFINNFDYKLTSMRGIDTVMAARFIAEIGDINRFSNPAKLAKYAGVSPVTYASGKTDCQFSNERGNRNLNEIFFRLAVTLTMTAGSSRTVLNSYFYDYFNKKLKEGKTKKQALKCVQRRLVNIIYGMMRNGTEYRNPDTYNAPPDEPEMKKAG
jgi:transposase